MAKLLISVDSIIYARQTLLEVWEIIQRVVNTLRIVSIQGEKLHNEDYMYLVVAFFIITHLLAQ